MEDKVSLVMTIFSVIPIFILGLGIWKEYVQYKKEKNDAYRVMINNGADTSEYEKIQNATLELESDLQSNNGEHHPEEVFINRAKLIRKETSWYKLVNSL